MPNETFAFQDYCKVKNETRLMHFVYEVEDGEYSLISGDCDFEKCRYSGSCPVIRQAIAKEEE